MDDGGSSDTSNGINQEVSNAGTAARVFSAKRRKNRTGSSSARCNPICTTWRSPGCACHWFNKVDLPAPAGASNKVNGTRFDWFRRVTRSAR